MPADTLEDGTSMKQFKFSSGTSESEKKLQITSFLSTVKHLKEAGFFRASITKLSLFDRVIGGLCWCVTSSGVAVDVDILFRENMDIGQKVILSESVVEACREMKCPYPLQANQISQCNDFGALLPVITFLCDAVIKWRMLTGDTTRIYSEMEFSSKGYTFPEENYNLEKSFLDKVLNRYTPNRVMRYSQDNWTGSREEEEARVQSCLLEYGEKFKRKKLSKDDEEKLNVVANATGGSSPGKGNRGGRLAGFEKEYARMQRLAEKEEEERAKTMESREKELLQQMSAVGGKGSKIKASGVAGIVAQNSDLIRSAAANLAKVEEDLHLGENNVEANSAKGLEMAHQRKVDALKKKIEAAKKEKENATKKVEALKKIFKDAKGALEDKVKYVKKVIAKTKELESMEGKAEFQEHLQTLKELIRLNETLKSKEKVFKAACVKQREVILQKKSEMEDSTSKSEDSKRLNEIDTMYDGVKKKYDKIRQLLAKKNQHISMVARQIDDVPTRTELIQYERRFVELYQQVDSKLEENRKYYDYYNTQQRIYQFLSKEAEMLQSINDTFLEGMRTKSNQKDFLEQMESLIGGIERTKESQEKMLGTVKGKFESNSKKHQKLVEKQRAYFKAVKDFQVACDKNELLEEQLEELVG